MTPEENGWDGSVLFVGGPRRLPVGPASLPPIRIEAEDLFPPPLAEYRQRGVLKTERPPEVYRCNPRV